MTLPRGPEWPDWAPVFLDNVADEDHALATLPAGSQCCELRCSAAASGTDPRHVTAWTEEERHGTMIRGGKGGPLWDWEAAWVYFRYCTVVVEVV